MKKLLALIAMISLLSVPAFADDCVEIDFEAEPELNVGVVYFFYGELTNCSDEAGMVVINISLSAGETSLDFPEFPIYMAAGQTISHSFPVVIPPVIPEGDVTITVTATKGEASDTDEIYLTVTHPGGGEDDGKNAGGSKRTEHAPQSITIK